MRACAYQSGQILFVPDEIRVPDGALVIAHAPAKVLEPIVKGLARRAYDNETLLVPGCPEAGEDDQAAFKAFMEFSSRVRAALKRKPVKS